jgi:hypothetical protein
VSFVTEGSHRVARHQRGAVGVSPRLP